MAGCSTLAGTRLTIQQAVNYAKQAGFTGNNLIVMVAVAQGESSLYTHAVNSCDPNGGSFGVVQINGVHFGARFGPGGQYTMSQAAAFDPKLAFLYAYELSNGTNFRPWGAYTNGSYVQYVDATRNIVEAGGDTSETAGVQFPPYSGQPWYNYPLYSDFPATSYHNTDVGTPPDTPITASLAGKITDLGYYDWGGSITIKVDTPSANNGYKDYFVIHLDAINPNLKKGMHVRQGTFLGYSGGETTLNDARLKPLPAGLKHHVTLPSHSTGPHLDIGVTSSDVGTLTDNTAAAKAASDHLVRLAQQGHIAFGTGLATGGDGGGSDFIAQDNPDGNIPSGLFSGPPNPADVVHNTLVQWPGFYGIARALDEAEHFPGFINDVQAPNNMLDATGWGEIPGQFLQSVMDTVIWNAIPVIVRSALILVGLFLLLALLWQLAKPNLEALPELVKLGALL